MKCPPGARHFPGTTSAEIFDGILNRTPIAPVRLNPELPEDFERIVNKCIEKDLNLRYQHASDLRADLLRMKRDLGGSASGFMVRDSDSRRSGVQAAPPAAAAESGGTIHPSGRHDDVKAGEPGSSSVRAGSGQAAGQQAGETERFRRQRAETRNRAQPFAGQDKQAAPLQSHRGRARAHWCCLWRSGHIFICIAE